MKIKENFTIAEEYLNQEFPKGKTKFRGQAMVLLALARQQEKLETQEKVKKLKDWINENGSGKYFMSLGIDKLNEKIVELFGK